LLAIRLFLLWSLKVRYPVPKPYQIILMDKKCSNQQRNDY